MHTVEPVFGSLQQYYGLRRMNVRGRLNACKVMLIAAAFNLKKWLKNSLNDASIAAINCILILGGHMALLKNDLNNYCLIIPLSYHSDCQWNERV